MMNLPIIQFLSHDELVLLIKHMKITTNVFKIYM